MTQDAEPTQAIRLIAQGMPVRVGRSVGRTLYVQVSDDPSKADLLIGVADSVAIARWIAHCCNSCDRQLDEFLTGHWR